MTAAGASGGAGAASSAALSLVELHALVNRQRRGVARIELANAIGLLIRRSQLRTVAEVCRATDADLLAVRGLTVRLLGRLRAYLREEGLC